MTVLSVLSYKPVRGGLALAAAGVFTCSTVGFAAPPPAATVEPAAVVAANSTTVPENQGATGAGDTSPDVEVAGAFAAPKKTVQQAAQELDAKRIRELNLKTTIQTIKTPEETPATSEPVTPTATAPQGNKAPTVQKDTTGESETAAAAARQSTAVIPVSATTTPQHPAVPQAKTPTTKAAPHTKPAQGTAPAAQKTAQKTVSVAPGTQPVRVTPVNYQATGGTNTKAPTVTSNNKTKAGIVETAKTGIGGTYIWGGKTFKAWDCSGYVSWVLAQHGIKTTAYTFAMKDELRPTSTPEPGDIVFQGGYNHVGIYLGDGMMVSALNPSEGTRIHPVNIMAVDGYYTAV